MRRVSSHIFKKGQYFIHTTHRFTIKPAFISRCLCTVNENKTKPSFSDKISKGPGLHEFISTENNSDLNFTEAVDIPYLKNGVSHSLQKKKVYFYVYGCQMNVNDTEVVWSILKKNNYSKTEVLEEADVILLVTCAIRDNAEIKIWNRLDHLRGLKKRRSESLPPLKIGILGCMAERLKHQLLEKEKCVDIVAGPDSYKDLPHLLNETENNQTAINVMLSLDETYADVMPVRLDSKSKTAYVTIMRGCDNMCTYCIVPFTRGRERSRPIQSILDEIKHLSDSGIKEVTLLGQNVNSYRDLSQDSSKEEKTQIVKGFKTVYKPKMGGIRFADLLDQVSLVDPEMRIRFTSPHPKDFPDEVLYLIKERPNVCKSLHLPFQAGNSAVLERMRRGYTKEAYLDLVQHVRNILPKVSLSTDVICGFCGETEEEFQDTLAVMEQVKFNIAYTFAYSMREKTAAHRRYVDDIPYEIKEHRLRQVANVFRKGAEELNRAQIGEIQLVLIEGKSRKSESMLAGRNDGNIKVLIPNMEVPDLVDSTNITPIQPGDYVAVKIEHSTSQTLRGTPLYHCNITSFHTQSIEDKQSLRNSL